MKKTIIALALGVMLTLTGATVALADDAPPVEEVPAVVVEQPAAEPEPVPVVVDEPQAEEPATPPVEEKKAEEARPEQPAEVFTEWYTWQMPDGSSDQAVKFPQTLVGAGIIDSDKCGVWYQRDKYTGTRKEIDAVLDGDKLTKGEDYSIVKEWSFSYGGDCKPDQPAPERSVKKAESCDLVDYGFGGIAGVVRQVTTTAYVWDAETWSWVLGEPVVGAWELVREYDDQEYFSCSPPPPPPFDPLIRYGKWKLDWPPSCDNQVVYKWRTIWLQHGGWAWDFQARTWVVYWHATEERSFEDAAEPEPFDKSICKKKPKPAPPADNGETLAYTGADEGTGLYLVAGLLATLVGGLVRKFS